MTDVTVAAGSALDVFFLAVAMAALATLLWMAYRTMQHPRLPVGGSADEPPRVTTAGVLRYLLTIPFMVAFWMSVLLFLLAAAARDRSGEQIVVATTAVIGGARLLAHVHDEIAHELAKAIPIAILGYILIGGGFSGWDGFLRTFDEVPTELVDAYLLGLLLFDVVVTALWFGWLRLSWRRTRRRVAAGGTSAGWLARTWRRLRDIGYAPDGMGSSDGAHRRTQ